MGEKKADERLKNVHRKIPLALNPAPVDNIHFHIFLSPKWSTERGFSWKIIFIYTHSGGIFLCKHTLTQLHVVLWNVRCVWYVHITVNVKDSQADYELAESSSEASEGKKKSKRPQEILLSCTNFHKTTTTTATKKEKSETSLFVSPPQQGEKEKENPTRTFLGIELWRQFGDGKRKKTRTFLYILRKLVCKINRKFVFFSLVTPLRRYFNVIF